jgi:hypothetical protein
MKQFAGVATFGHGGPPVAGGLRAKATALGWNQSPSNWAGTGPPGGGDAGGIGVTPFEGAEAGPVPTALVAATVKM